VFESDLVMRHMLQN